ncbi:MAG: glycosyl hydrolase [Bacteroidota bacterium]
MRYRWLLFLLVSFSFYSKAQLKFIVEDFEGCYSGHSDSDNKQTGIFTFGNIKSAIINETAPQPAYLGQRYIQLTAGGKLSYGGWGKGTSINIELNYEQDYLNFYVYQPASNGKNIIKIELQEDDNDDNKYAKNVDDSWNYSRELINENYSETKKWQLISIPLNKFTDSNNGGDGVFNINYKAGKLLCIIISFIEPAANKKVDHSNGSAVWFFDFICFSKGELPVGTDPSDAPAVSSENGCSLGAWSKEGNTANFADIAINFEKNFSPESKKKLGVVHFFQPFAVDGGSTQNHYPSVERINKIIQEGYIPMITLEDHFVNTKPDQKQPNLYSIIEGHFDPFFIAWAKEIKQVNDVVLLRILHEFNGDWYPWCIVNNNKDPKLLIKAYCHIHSIFKQQNVTNVKFIWCPNSTSFPQEKWNYIMDAYPGNEFVDYIGFDVYNGAGKETPVWRSFRKEAIENYFIATQQLPDKPIFICETASRERQRNESSSAQNKAEWIQQMSQALKTDMSKVKLLTWFNEKETFKVNSSEESQKAFLNYILKDDYFKSGTKYLYSVLH